MRDFLMFATMTWATSIFLVLAALRRAAEAPWWETTLDEIDALTMAGDPFNADGLSSADSSVSAPTRR
jgi:hypothetical protein